MAGLFRKPARRVVLRNDERHQSGFFHEQKSFTVRGHQQLWQSLRLRGHQSKTPSGSNTPSTDAMTMTSGSVVATNSALLQADASRTQPGFASVAARSYGLQAGT